MTVTKTKKLYLRERLCSDGEHPDFGKFEFDQIVPGTGFLLHVRSGEKAGYYRISTYDIVGEIFDAIENGTFEEEEDQRLKGKEKQA